MVQYISVVSFINFLHETESITTNLTMPALRVADGLLATFKWCKVAVHFTEFGQFKKKRELKTGAAIEFLHNEIFKTEKLTGTTKSHEKYSYNGGNPHFINRNSRNHS